MIASSLVFDFCYLIFKLKCDLNVHCVATRVINCLAQASSIAWSYFPLPRDEHELQLKLLHGVG